MRVSVVSSIAVLLGSAALVSANCNPSYDVAAPGDCVKECKIKAGRGLWDRWTDDPASPDFIESLGYKCERGNPAYTSFMTSSGTCMMNCPEDQNNDYGSREHPDSCTWFAAHKNDECAEEGGSSASPSGGSSTSPSASGDADKPADSSAADDAAQQDGESAATKVQLGGLVAALAVAGSAALF